MKKNLLLGVSFAALAAVTPAIAADMPVKAPIAPVVAPYNWTGFYVGGNIGYSWGNADIDLNASGLALFGSTGFSESLKLDGLIGGGQIGYNWQRDNKWVFGLEADFQGSAEKDSANRDPLRFFIPAGEGSVAASLNQSLEAKIQWFGTVRGRLGLLVTPTVLLYGTGGLAYGRIEANSSATLTVTLTNANNQVTTTSLLSSIDDSKTKFGWTVGGGIEGAIPNTRDWTWKVEYLYIDFGTISGAGTDPVLGNFSWSTKVTDNIIRGGINYRFH
jgi:outer membrane immunogenic protein